MSLQPSPDLPENHGVNDARTVLGGLGAFTLTPFDSKGIVDSDHLQQLVSRLANTRIYSNSVGSTGVEPTSVDSIGVLGSTGSYMYLHRDQRTRALHAAVEAALAEVAGIADEVQTV